MDITRHNLPELYESHVDVLTPVVSPSAGEEGTMEVERAAGGDLLMECDEEEQEVWPRTQETVKEKDEGEELKWAEFE